MTFSAENDTILNISEYMCNDEESRLFELLQRIPLAEREEERVAEDGFGASR